MKTAFRVYTVNLAAGATQELPVSGDQVLVLSSTGNVTVRLDSGSILENISAGMGNKGEPFTRMQVKDESGGANTVRIVIAGTDFINQRVVGEVSVIDGGLSRTLAGRAFVVGGELAASVGNYSLVQLWNPPANPYHIAVSAVAVSSNTASPSFRLRSSTAALSTVFTNPNTKKLGGLNSLAEVRIEANAALVGTGNLFYALYGGSLFQPVPLKEQIVLPPGYGLISANAVVNAHNAVNFDIYEFIP